MVQYEKVMVAFSEFGPFPICVYGQTVEGLVHSDATVFFEQVQGGLTKDDPEYGLHVWEGMPTPVYGGTLEDGSYIDYYDFSEGIWREVTASELCGFLRGVNPWELLVQLREAINDDKTDH